MFKIKNKLSSNLKTALEKNIYKNYRVIISCRSLLEKIEKRVLSSKGELLYTLPNLNCISANISKRTIERLSEYPEVKYIDFDSLVFSIPFNHSPISNIEKTKVNNPYTQIDENKYSLNGKDVCIGIIGTGIYPHSDFTKPDNRIVKFLDLTENYTYTYDNCGLGTFIAGIIGGNGYSSKGSIKGVAPRCNFYSIKVFDNTERAFASTILHSIYTLIEESREYNIKLIYLPLETFEFNPFILELFEKTFDYVAEMGLTIIIPTGSNSNKIGTICGISSLNNCICIGGISSINPPILYKYSSSGPYKRKHKPDFLAPCYKKFTTNLNIDYIPEKDNIKLYPHALRYNYAEVSSVALSAAYICGICAMLYEHKSDLTMKDIYSLLKLSATPLELPKESMGNGIVLEQNLTLTKDDKKKHGII
ncbi:S8 family serine peptidase [Hathewaya histolytica]|uniref:S8 family serine peptidase n=1 Tax=Hathewaya histolytica TaxID=1498 RepID=UPI003B67ACD2